MIEAVVVRSWALWTALAGSSLPLAAQHLQQLQHLPVASYDEGLARYRECLERVPFVHHTEGRQQLASSRRPEGLELLVADYRAPQAYPEYTRYTLASLFGVYYGDAASLPALRALREACDEPADSWLWVRTLAAEAEHTDATDVLAIAREAKSPYHRAAAIAALGRAGSRWLPQAIAANCADLPRRDWQRNVLLGAMSGAILDNRGKANDEGFRTGLRAYIGLLDESVGLSHTAAVQVSRHLMWTLDAPRLFVTPEPWLRILDQGDVKLGDDEQTVAQPRFFGIETEGERFCYVVDMSDSMCRELDPGARPRGPVTGPKRERRKGALPDEDDLPWHEIHTRFDLAREQLKISLQRLDKDKYFSVIWFGDESGTLDSCRGMVKATRGNIARVIRELDAIEPGAPEPLKAPEGVLRGKTNMHSGLRRAFGLSRRGFVEAAAYVDPDALTEGCDTIFLLSDGAPSWDDFHTRDKDYGEGMVVIDTEYAAGAQRTPQLIYFGPYDQPHWLVEDVRRMNAFRRVRIHCIGIGEANMSLLRQLAELGNGEVYAVGNQKPRGR